MKPGDLVRLKTFTRDLNLMNCGLSGGIALLVSKHSKEQDPQLWDMMITRHPTYGGNSEFVAGVSQDDIFEVFSIS